MRRDPERDSKQTALFAAAAQQGCLNLNLADELNARARAAVLEIDATTRALLNATRETARARAASVDGPRECAMVEAMRILEAAQCAILNARTLLTRTLEPVASESEEA